MKNTANLIDDAFVTIRTASKMLNRSVRTIRGWVHSGRINAIKESSGYRWLIPIEEINREKELDAIFSEGK